MTLRAYLLRLGILGGSIFSIACGGGEECVFDNDCELGFVCSAESTCVERADVVVPPPEDAGLSDATVSDTGGDDGGEDASMDAEMDTSTPPMNTEFRVVASIRSIGATASGTLAAVYSDLDACERTDLGDGCVQVVCGVEPEPVPDGGMPDGGTDAGTDAGSDAGTMIAPNAGRVEVRSDSVTLSIAPNDDTGLYSVRTLASAWWTPGEDVTFAADGGDDIAEFAGTISGPGVETVSAFPSEAATMLTTTWSTEAPADAEHVFLASSGRTSVECRATGSSIAVDVSEIFEAGDTVTVQAYTEREAEFLDGPTRVVGVAQAYAGVFGGDPVAIATWDVLETE